MAILRGESALVKEISWPVWSMVATGELSALVFFIGGWTRYAITHNYSNDVVQGSLAGIGSVLKMYQSGSFKKDKEMNHLMELEENGELEKWVVEQLAKK